MLSFTARSSTNVADTFPVPTPTM
ncbi:MAG: CRISPR-associated protein Cas5 [Ignavibacteriales bacterium]|nr:CRISPR-associated protein Cas5 [Ignavibacteriales bacterium]